MFNFDDLYKIEIELTTKCQAHCPMCSRNFHGYTSNNNVKQVEWSFDDFKKIINQDVLDRVKLLNFCGAFGEPLMCKDVLKIISYVSENSNAEIITNTNGSFYKPSWWKQLAEILPKKHLVIFGIDGFKGTHEKHRIGTNFDKIIENATAFIEAGGNAGGQFINFKHNEHEYEDLKIFLKNKGFNIVFKINPDRFRTNSFPVLGKYKNKLYDLEPTDNEVVSFKDADLPHIIDNQNKIKINCRSIARKEIYINAYKHLYPCCETATILYEIEKLDETNFNNILPSLKNEVKQVFKEYNNIGYIDLKKVGIKSIMEDPKYLSIWKKHWDLKKVLVCSAVCGTIENQKFLDRDSQFVF